MTIQSERVNVHYLIHSRVVIYVQCWKDSNMAYWLCHACSIGRWRWWRCLIRNWTHNGQFGKLLQQLLLGRVEMRRNMREYSSARIVNIFFISMHLCALPMAAIHVFPAKTPWKEKIYEDIGCWLAAVGSVHEDPLTNPPYHETSAVLLHITSILKINTGTNEIWQNMSEHVPKKVMPLSVYGDKTDSLHFWPLHDLLVTVYV